MNNTKAINRIRCSSLIHFEIVYILYIKLFIDTLGIPNAAWYLCDLINSVLLIKCLKARKGVFHKVGASRFCQLLGIIFIFSLCGLLINMNGIALYIWGFRNVGRMFGFWIACISFLDKDDLIKIFRSLYIAYLINFCLSLLQYASGIKGDSLGGIFGTTGASSSYSLNLCMIVVTVAVCGYLNYEVSLRKTLFIVLISMVIAPLAELKALYFLFGGMLLIVLVMSKRLSPRIGLMVIGGLVGLYVAVRIMSIVYPESLVNLTFEGMSNYLGGNNGIGYSSTNDLSRTGAIGTLYEMFFKDDPLRNIFGFGLGSCETSNFSFLNSAFYQKYEYLHYRWFFDAMLYLEMGLGGLILFAIFVIMIYVYIRKHKNDYFNEDKSFVILAIVFVVYTFVLAVYNGSLRIESGFLVYLVLAVPFILRKSKTNDGVSVCREIFNVSKFRVKWRK